MKENIVERRLIRRCARAPFTVLCIKAEALGKGWPDRILLAYNHRVAFVELKRPGGIRGPRQRLVRKMLRALGFECEFLASPAAVDLFMDDFLNRCWSSLCDEPRL